ncbi:MAG: nucleotide exchange factor GrpE [Candidatus Pacebacteria bacterium]|nr:nucleotide exchange factor GrpE [Candidatus Paceibacterota bacterium]
MSDDNFEEEFVPEEEAEQGPALIKRLRDRLKKATEERQEYLEGWQRSRADFANFKREEALMNEHKEVRVKAGLVEDLIPVLDSFEMMLKHAQTKEMNLVHKQFLDALRKMDILYYGKKGDTFDPYKYEALREVAVETPEDDQKVVSVERSGYSIGEHIIRPAQVTVGAYQK